MEQYKGLLKMKPEWEKTLREQANKPSLRSSFIGILGDKKLVEEAATSSDPSERIKAAVNRGRFAFPVSEQATSDGRLPLGAEVLVVRLAGEEKAYALLDVAAEPANDHVGGAPIVVFGSGDALAAYVARADGRELTFVAGPGSALTDRETGSTWDLGGRAIAGPLEGTTLELVPARRALWFAVAGSSPGVGLFRR